MEPNFFLGLQVKQTEVDIFIFQEKYENELVKKFQMDKCKKFDTPMSPSTKLDKDEKHKSIDSKLYKSIIRSLLYLAASKHVILFSVCSCMRFQLNPEESNATTVKRIIKYVGSYQKLGLWHPRIHISYCCDT